MEGKVSKQFSSDFRCGQVGVVKVLLFVNLGYFLW